MYDIRNEAKKLVALSTALMFLSVGAFAMYEPSAVQAQSTDDVIVTLNVSSEIVISDGADASMTPDIGLTNDTSTGSSSWTVETSASGGYTLAVKASTDPALQSASDSFADYTTSGGIPDSWSVATGDFEFGFSAFGDDVNSGEYGAGTSCDGSGDPGATSMLYEGFNGTTDITIADSSSTTPSGGTETTICFGAEQNGVNAPSGTYTATITATATSQ